MNSHDARLVKIRGVPPAVGEIPGIARPTAELGTSPVTHPQSDLSSIHTSRRCVFEGGGESEMTHPTRVEEESPNTSVVTTRCIDRDPPDFFTSSLLVIKQKMPGYIDTSTHVNVQW